MGQSFGGLIAPTILLLSRRFGYQYTFICSLAFCCLSLFLSSFIENLHWLLLTYSLPYGYANTAIYLLGTLLCGLYYPASEHSFSCLRHVYHFHRLSSRLSRDECVHLLVYRKWRLAIDETADSSDRTGCNVCPRAAVHGKISSSGCPGTNAFNNVRKVPNPSGKSTSPFPSSAGCSVFSPRCVRSTIFFSIW